MTRKLIGDSARGNLLSETLYSGKMYAKVEEDGNIYLSIGNMPEIEQVFISRKELVELIKWLHKIGYLRKEEM